MKNKWTLCCIATSAILAIGLILSVSTFANAYITVNANNDISVTGQAKSEIQADMSSWVVTVSASAVTKEDAYESLIRDKELALNYLKEKTSGDGTQKLSDDEITVSQVNTSIEYERDAYYNRTNIIMSYDLYQNITIKTPKVFLVDELSRDITDALGPNVNIISNNPSFYCSDLSEKKVEMVKLATDDSYNRAKGIVESTKRKLGTMKSAKTGVFQIVPVGSTQVDDYGINDDSTIDKEIICTVKTVFSIN